MSGRIVAVCTSAKTGQQKQRVERAVLLAGHGIQGDAHAGTWHRQVSLLAEEHIDEMRRQGLELPPGAFGENIVTRGIDLDALEVGRRLRIGDGVVVQITQRGKECHDHCAIYQKVGDCIMPRVGLFARVRRGGAVAAGDALTLDPELDMVRYAVVTLSDRAVFDGREDRSGPLVRELVEAAINGGGNIRCRAVDAKVLPDDRAALEAELRRLCDDEVCDLVLTTGGTGLSPRDITPDATLAVIDRQIPGMAEAMRAAGLSRGIAHAMLSRAVCGMRGQTVIVNLSGSPKAVREQLEALLPALPHAVQTAAGIPQDCARTS
jgi:molybdenum cofactor synthesis domain-containing protein